jgi:hypothetical protein
MVGGLFSPRRYLLLCAGAVIIAAICVSGVVLKDDLAGRVIFGAVWALVGIGWLGQYFRANRAAGRTCSEDSG